MYTFFLNLFSLALATLHNCKVKANIGKHHIFCGYNLKYLKLAKKKSHYLAIIVSEAVIQTSGGRKGL